MKRLISCLLAAVMVFGVYAVSFAVAGEFVEFDQITGKLVVKDENIENVSSGDIVTMIILKPEFSFDALENGEITLSQSAYAVKQTQVVEENNQLSYSFGEWVLPASTALGTYNVRVGINGTYVKEGSFYFLTLDILKQAVSDINNASASQMQTELSSKSALFGIDLESYNALIDKGMVNEKMAAEDFSLAQEATTQEIDAVVTKIKDKLREFVAISALQEEENAENIEALLLENADIYNIDLSESSDYGKLSEAAKVRVLERMKDESFVDSTSVAESFNTHCVLVKFESGSYGDVESILSNNNDILGFDLTAYNNLSSEEKVYVHKKMVENSPVYNTTLEAKNVFDAAVTAAPSGVTSQEGTDRPSDKNSGSSGGGSSKTIALPNIMNENKQEQQPVTPQAPQQQTQYFTDIGNVSWAEESINALYEAGVVSGKASGIFAPNDNVTRAEFIKMLTEAILEVDENATSTFTDVSEGDWYYKYAATCQENGLVLGYEDGSLKPHALITRQEMAVMVKRFVNYVGAELKSGSADVFSDSALIADYAKEAAGELYASGIINGDENLNFMPNSFTTRAQAAKVIFETMKLCRQEVVS